MNLYKSITESSWDISEDERIRMYNLIQSIYGPKWTEKQIENINTTTDEKLERLYNSALKKFKKKQATQKEVSIEDRIPTYVKDSYKEYIRNHTRTFNNKHNSEEELVKAEDNMNRSIKSFIEEYYPDLYIELWKEDLMEETNMNIYENIKKNLKESEAPQTYERGNAPFESKRVPEDRIREEGYLYFSTHGTGPGTKPRDVRVREMDWDLPGGWVAIKTDRPLTSEELDWYDIQPETKNSYYRKRFGLEESSLKEEENIVCRHCGEKIEDIENCETDQYWTNDGDRIVYHICPECGEALEDIDFDSDNDEEEL